MSVGDWIVTLIILGIPIVNVVMLIVWAISETTHPSKKSYARAVIILALVGIVLVVIFALIRTVATPALPVLR